MKIKLLRDSKVTHRAGEVVEASPAEAAFLISVNSAIEVREPVKAVRKRGARIDEDFNSRPGAGLNTDRVR